MQNQEGRKKKNQLEILCASIKWLIYWGLKLGKDHSFKLKCSPLHRSK